MPSSKDDSQHENGERLIWFEGGDGRTREDAVVIRGVEFDLAGTAMEFAWLEETFGIKDVDWRLLTHSHGTYGDKEIDSVTLELPSGEQRTVYFDITESFGKWPG